MAKVSRSDDEWRQQLSAERYDVLRRSGTERPFSGELNDNKRPGRYRCGACGARLFESETKFDSGTGWPSFYAPASEEAVATRTDRGLFTSRTEVLCASCESHLGHVFADGPRPTGQRYCINSLALDFEGESEEAGA